MMLQPDASQPGLWVNPEWQPGSPGTFAVIIGVSQYDHLPGGRGTTAQDTYGLGQLYVSALTAYRFFRWLTEKYQYQKPQSRGCSLAKCWLLLSPNSAEQGIEPRLNQNLLRPTFNNCRTAIRQFRNEMRRLARTEAEGSRSFFFFSGHGLEITQDQQVLLPCDYLNPDDGALNDAISTQNLLMGLAELDVPEHFYFVDACRNDHRQLRERQIKGNEILDVSPSYQTNAGRNTPLFYASASGTQAWQPMDVRKGPSLFGRALLEGLAAQHDMEIDRSASPWSVQIAPLQKYTRIRVQQLLQEQGATVSQYVRLGGVIADLEAIVTQIETPVEETELPQTKGPSDPSPFPSNLKFRYGTPQDLPGWHPSRQGTQFTYNFQTLDIHDVIGSERVTELWYNTRVYSLGRKRWLDSDEDYAVRRIRRDGTRAYLIELVLLHNEGGHWFEMSDPENTFACLLPDDSIHGAPTAPIYLLELEVDGDRRMIRLNASLAPDNEGFLGEMAQQWEIYQDTSITDAVNRLTLEKAEHSLFYKLESPLAATVAGLVLLRANRQDLLRDWLHNLAHWFPDRPDGPVLRVEQLMQQSVETNSQEIVDSLLMLGDRGLPQTSEGFGYAVRQIEAVLRFTQLNDAQREQLEQLQQRFQKALPCFRTGGLFSTFAGRKGELSPELVER